jgi:hypothetical protein
VETTQNIDDAALTLETRRLDGCFVSFTHFKLKPDGENRRSVNATRSAETDTSRGVPGFAVLVRRGGVLERHLRLREEQTEHSTGSRSSGVQFE